MENQYAQMVVNELRRVAAALENLTRVVSDLEHSVRTKR